MKKIFTMFAVLLMMAVSTKAQTQPINVVCTSASDQPVPPTTCIIKLQNAEYQFTFYIKLSAGEQDITDGRTYTWTDMFDFSSGMNKTTSEDIMYASVSFIKNGKSYVVDVTDTLGQQYHITYSPAAPITEPKDTVIISMSNANNRNCVYDRTSSQGNIYLYGYSDDDKYRMNLEFITNTFAGTYTLADRCPNDIYFTFAEVTPTGDENPISCNNLLDATVTGTVSDCTAHIEWVAEDSTMYDITFSYSEPIAEKYKTFTATDLTITKSSSYETYETQGIYVYNFEAFCNELRLFGVVNNSNADNPLGTWTYDSGTTLSLLLIDYASTVDRMNNPYSATITITQDEKGMYSLTGTALMYNHTQWTFNCTQADSTDTAIRNVENAEFFVISEHNAITVRAAEGENITVCDMTGRTIMNVKAASNVERINLAAPGIYAVRIGKKTVKVLVR